MVEGSFGLAETTSSIGGFFGDVLEGLKPATIDALGYSLRSSAGVYDGLRAPVAPADIGPQPGTEAPAPWYGGGDNKTLMYVGIGLASVAGLVLIAKG